MRAAEERPGGAFVVTFKTSYDLDDYRDRRLRQLCEAIKNVYGRRPARLLLTVRGHMTSEVQREELADAYREER